MAGHSVLRAAPHRRPPLLAVAALLSASLAAPANASEIYRWTDARGTVHYGDRVDAGVDRTQVRRIATPAAPSAMARLRVQREGDAHLAFADNLLAGPIEVMLHAEDGRNLAADPALPARATVPAYGGTLVARVGAADAQRALASRLYLTAVPGDPSARPRDVEYGYPLQTAALRVEQGWGGRFSHHDDENRHAVDFAAAVGTPVLAAREGVVMQVESGFDRAGLDAEADRGRANFVRVLHEDGSMALYAHLDADGARVRVGQRVRRGEVLGLSGNTGFSSGPHLHFVVQVNRGLRLHSIPFRMFGPHGILRFAAPTHGTAD